MHDYIKKSARDNTFLDMDYYSGDMQDDSDNTRTDHYDGQDYSDKIAVEDEHRTPHCDTGVATVAMSLWQPSTSGFALLDTACWNHLSGERCYFVNTRQPPIGFQATTTACGKIIIIIIIINRRQSNLTSLATYH
jgi:hypothetical protein